MAKRKAENGACASNRSNLARARDELLTALPGRAAKIREAIAQTEKHMRINRLKVKWAPWEGTPETNEAIARVPSHRRQSALARMAALGKITADDLAAAHEIAGVVEMIERGAAVCGASMEARVDYAGSGRDALIESLGRIRTEVAYRLWRDRIPMPKAMILDMIVRDSSYVRTAPRYGLHWQTARRRLINALGMWSSCKIDARHAVGNEQVIEIYQRLGEGVLLPPKPRSDQMPNINERDAA